MTQRRVTTTNQLSTVIDVLQLGRRTGLLTVERGAEGNFEEGTMTFMNGQVVQATIGPYTGRDAIVKLFSWQACHFSFVPLQPDHTTQSTAPLAPEENRASAEKQQYSFHEDHHTNPDGQDDLRHPPAIVPYYKAQMDNTLRILEQQGFSRIHRRLFLLIDGRRQVRELATLISRTPSETVALLADLQRAGLIQL